MAVATIVARRYQSWSCTAAAAFQLAQRASNASSGRWSFGVEGITTAVYPRATARSVHFGTATGQHGRRGTHGAPGDVRSGTDSRPERADHRPMKGTLPTALGDGALALLAIAALPLWIALLLGYAALVVARHIYW